MSITWYVSVLLNVLACLCIAVGGATVIARPGLRSVGWFLLLFGLFGALVIIALLATACGLISLS